MLLCFPEDCVSNTCPVLFVYFFLGTMIEHVTLCHCSTGDKEHVFTAESHESMMIWMVGLQVSVRPW